MPKRPRGISFQDLGPIGAIRQLGPMLEQKLQDVVELSSTEEGRRKLRQELNADPAEPKEEVSKKQQWVLKAMQQNPKFEEHIFQYARFFMQQQTDAKRIVVHGINEKDMEPAGTGAGSKSK